MKSAFIILFLNVLLIITPLAGQKTMVGLPGYPEFKVVVSKFLSEYSINDIENPEQFRMAKMPDGWHAQVVNILTSEVMKDQLYWERRKKRYRKSDFPKAGKEEILEDHTDLTGDWQNNYFSGILPYWGYAGWDKDVIDEYGEKANLSDAMLNAIARAYISYASNLLNNNSGFSSEDVMFDLPSGRNSLNAEQLAEYRKYEHAGIDAYYRLWKLNPSFETFVGDALNLYSNQIMTAYLNLLCYQNEEEAAKELKPGLYDDFLIDMAERYLASCDSNSVLIVNGDNDTYPLLYVQEVLGYRKDVTVINISLLGTTRYRSLFLEGMSGEKNLAVSMPKDYYKDDSKSFLYVYEKTDSIGIDKLISFIQSPDEESKLEFGGVKYDYIPSRKIIISISPETGETQLSADIKNSYMLMSHFFLIDLISTSGFKRPVYFAISVDQENFLGLESNFRCEGLAYKITPEKNPTSELCYTDANIQFEKLMRKPALENLNEMAQYSNNHKRVIQNYRWIYSGLVKKLVEENKKDSALAVLNYCEKEFPSSRVPHDYASLRFLEAYYQLGFPEPANRMAEEFLAALGEKQNNPETGKTDEYDQMVLREILKRLAEITGQYVPESDLHQRVMLQMER